LAGDASVQKYRRKQQTMVVAIRLDLDTDGLIYRKWGGTQQAKRGDWLVNNNGDVYTVDADTFARTYSELSRGIYEKTANVWARQAENSGIIKTKEGSTDYQPGDYLVFNNAGGEDGYAVTAERFHELYEPIM
jgi:hypothetical protein